MNKKLAAKCFKKMGGREGISKRILEIAQDIVESGSYKRAVAGAGQIKVLADIADKADCYWSEKMRSGYNKEIFFAENESARKPILADDGSFHRDFWAREDS